MKLLVVGDPHIMIKNLEDSEKLMRFVLDKAKENNAKIMLMGDLFHNHTVIRMEVLNFWQKWFGTFSSEGVETFVIVGNHDMHPIKALEQEMNALNAFKFHNLHIINKPTLISENMLGMPYMSDHEAFLNLVNEKSPTTLFAHQTFTGATYDNGFYAEDGIDPKLVNSEAIISGHIHTSQTIGKCFYVGTPKWDSISDANQDKGVWIFEFENGKEKNRNFISTKDIVTPIIKTSVSEGEDLPSLKEGDRNFLELTGSSAWINKVRKKYKDIAQIKAIPTDKRQRRATSKDGGPVSLNSFLEKHFTPIDGINVKDINKYLSEVVSV